jgi:processive 1,2-diacylglycerol beta-glucosyltransferase
MNGGNGTVSASLALKEYIEGKGAQCSVFDFMKEINPLCSLLAEVYNSLLKGDLRFASWYMELAHMFPINSFTPFNFASRKRTLKLLHREKPDTIVLICPWIIDAVLLALKEYSSNRPRIYTVVVDLGEGITPSWYNGEVDFTVLPTLHARDYLGRYGLLEGRYGVMGMPLSPSILHEKPSREDSLELLGVDAPLCTVMGGREGGKNSLRIVDMLIRENMEAGILIQCGNNKDLAKAASRRKGLKVVGFLDSIISLYRASDVVITKPGALTVSELIALKKPFIIDTHPVVMPQERGNVKFVREEGLGMVAEKLTDIPGMVKKVLAEEVKSHIIDIYGTDRIGDMILSEGPP